MTANDRITDDEMRASNAETIIQHGQLLERIADQLADTPSSFLLESIMRSMASASRYLATTEDEDYSPLDPLLDAISFTLEYNRPLDKEGKSTPQAT